MVLGLGAFVLSASACGAATPTATQTATPTTALMSTLTAPQTAATMPAVPGEGFRLYVLKGKAWQLNLGDTQESSWSVLSTVDLKDYLLVLGPQDISSYDWSQQTITLAAEAADKILEAFPPPFPDVGTDRTPFVVTFDGERLYGGIFMIEGSAQDIGYPVIYLLASGEQIQFLVRPLHMGYGYAYRSFSPSDRGRIEVPEVRDYFAGLGKLTG